MGPSRSSRRAVLQAVGTGVLGIAVADTTTAAVPEPDPDEYEEILDAMAGSGDHDDPYVITDLRELRAVEAGDSPWCVLDNDIDGSVADSWNDGSGFGPIPELIGTLDGRGHAIRGLTIETSGDEATGLFGRLQSGRVENLHVEATVEGSHAVGIVAGEAESAAVRNVSVSGRVEGEFDVGGLVGAWMNYPAWHNELTRCVSESTVIGQSHVGGLVGKTEHSPMVRECASSGSVRGSEAVGGIVGTIGDFEAALLENCCSSASVSATGSVREAFGGIVGRCGQATLRNCRAAGDVHARTANEVGGLAGRVESESPEVARCSAAGNVHGRHQVGGLIGSLSETDVTECFATGDVVGGNVGGLVGGQRGTVRDAYATGAVRGCEGSGGLVSYNSEPVARTFATHTSVDEYSANGLTDGDEDRVEQSYWIRSSGEGTSSAASGSSELRREDVLGDAAASALQGFDFEDVWRTREGELPALDSFESTIAIAAIEAPETAASGDPIRVDAVLVNDGDSTAHDPVVLEVGGLHVRSQYSGLLDPGERTSVTFVAPTLPDLRGDVEVAVRVGYETTATTMTVTGPAESEEDGTATALRYADPCQYPEERTDTLRPDGPDNFADTSDGSGNDDEATGILALSIGGVLGIFAIIFRALRKNGNSS